MGNINYFDELIVSYLSNELNSEEETFVLQWINSSEENRRHFENLKNTWNLLATEQTVKEVDVDKEWSRFRQSVSKKQVELSVLKFPPCHEQYSEEAFTSRKLSLHQLFLTAAVAASLILLVVFGWSVFYSNEPIKNSSSLAVTNEPPPKILITHKANKTGKIQLITLPDGSLVKLYSKSELIYDNSFNENKRDIRLSGKAHFEVVKDKIRLFTVYSGKISTTALGTQFTVTAYDNARNIAVRLYQGKVVVKSTNDGKTKLDNNFFLLPGQELIFDNKNLMARVRSYRLNNNVALKDANNNEKLFTDNPIMPVNGKGSWYMFNNQPLSQVFAQLEGMYNVHIVYPTKELSKIYFIGTFNVTDSLDNILEQITSLNNLRIRKKNNKIIISKD